MTHGQALPHPALYAAVGACARPAAGYAFHVLARMGLRPLGFHGRLLFSCADHGGPGQTHASGLEVFEISGGGYAAAWHHRRLADGQVIWRHAHAAPDAAALVAALRLHSPLVLRQGGALAGYIADDAAESWRAILALALPDAA